MREKVNIHFYNVSVHGHLTESIPLMQLCFSVQFTFNLPFRKNTIEKYL